ncbi:MAG: tail fiber domain-containing protein [Saprospiraceae bacterium]|jgi:hypothetical protein|nr:tail fiber domain-containing protein [Saprospiraceae bacterium]
MKKQIFLFFISVSTFVNAQNVGINNIDPQAALDLKGDLRLRSETLSGIINGINNNVNISTLKSSVYTFNPSINGCTISGFNGGVDGRIITIFNNTLDVVELIDESNAINGSIADNKILTGTGNSAIIGGKGSVTLRYDESKMRWTIVSSNFTSGLDDNPNPWYTDGINIFNQNSGNVGVGSQVPVAKLQVEGATSSPTIPGMISNGIFRINSNNASGLDVGQINDSPYSFWMQGGAIGVASLPMAIQPQGGNVGIGTTAPAPSAVLDLASTTQGFLPPRMTEVQIDAIATPAEGLILFCTDCNFKGLHQFINGKWQALNAVWKLKGNSGIDSTCFIGTTDNKPLILKSNNIEIARADTNGNLYVGNINVKQSYSVIPGVLSYTNLNISGNSIQTTYFHGYDFGSSENADLKINTAGGNVGIRNSGLTQNKLQIGNTPNFVGYDLAVGNGIQQMALTQSPTVSIWYSDTNFAPMPAGGTGRVGIGTTAPEAPLHVVGAALVNSSYAFYAKALNGLTGAPITNTGGGTSTIDVSIYASNRVLASEFNAQSDARHKSITNRNDNTLALSKLLKLAPTNYKFIDTVGKGNREKLGFIAQEVEAVLPLAVSKTADYVPNIFAMAKLFSYEEGSHTLTIYLEKEHGLELNDEIKIVSSSNEFGKITKIIDKNTFIMDNIQKKPEGVFVFGKKVNDFRVVDYDHIFTLGISAIQQLAKENEALKSKISTIESRFDKLEASLKHTLPLVSDSK